MNKSLWGMNTAPSRKPHKVLPGLRRIRKQLECMSGDLPFPSKHYLGDDCICSCNRKRKDEFIIFDFGCEDFYRSNIQRVFDTLEALLRRVDLNPLSFEFGNVLVLHYLNQMLCELEALLCMEAIDSRRRRKEVVFMKKNAVHRFSIKQFSDEVVKIYKHISAVYGLAKSNILLAETGIREFFE